MQPRENSIISAQVILRPASGKKISGKVMISAKNVAEFAPSPGEVSAVAAEFRSGGFDTGPLVGISFSVTGTISTFEKFFGIKIQIGKDKGYEFVTGNKTFSHELPGNELPELLRKSIHAVAFTLPPDFGPTDFHS